MINVELVKQLCYKTLQMDLRGETENNPSLADRFLGSGESRVICRFEPEYSLQLKLFNFHLQMEVFAVEVDLERATCLHWHVHGDIHGVSVSTKLIQ